jgi:acyl-CoA-binding protein
LTLYAFYKQAVLGKCDAGAKPSAIDMAARAKWESWMALGDMPREVSKQQYIGLVKELFAHFDETGEAHQRGPHALADQIRDGEKDEAMGMAGVVSMPTVDLSAPEWQVKEDMFHYASTGELKKVEEALSRGGDVDAQDDEARTMLHWAVDRSQRDVVELLLQLKASPNVQVRFRVWVLSGMSR